MEKCRVVSSGGLGIGTAELQHSLFHLDNIEYNKSGLIFFLFTYTLQINVNSHPLASDRYKNLSIEL